MNIYEGDPKIFITENGADMQVKGGQPLMDQGIENFVSISLFTRKGWFGNFFISDINKNIGSDYLKTTEKPITISSLNAIRLSTEKALKNQVVGKVSSSVTNPQKNFINNDISIAPPGQDIQELTATSNGTNWQLQAKEIN